MTEAEWLVCEDPAPMVLSFSDRGSERKLQLFAVACCRRIWDFLGDVDRWIVELVEESADCQVDYEVVRPLRRSQGGGKPTQTVWAYYAVDFLAWPWGNHRSHIAYYVTETIAKGAPREMNLPILMCRLLRDIFGNPFRPVAFSPDWRSDTTVSLARQMYESREFSAMPILADALQDAGCDNDDILNHCRCDGAHVRGCWVVDLVLGKQ
jgi:hypothetical protein